MTTAPASDLTFSHSTRPVARAGFLPPSRAWATTFFVFLDGAPLRGDRLAMTVDGVSLYRLNESSGPYALRARLVSARVTAKNSEGDGLVRVRPPGLQCGRKFYFTCLLTSLVISNIE